MAVQADFRNDTIVQMRPVGERNNLEKYLDDLKEKETDYCIDQEEVRFIQSGIETLVQKIYDLVTKENKTRVDCKNNDNILKVGSFYEGTKNKFPNEFDFIFVIAKLDTEGDTTFENKLSSQGRNSFSALTYAVLSKLKCCENEWKIIFKDSVKKQVPALKQSDKCTYFHAMIYHVVNNDLKYSDNASRSIYFQKYVKLQGPASKLMFIYQRDKCKDICLHVDIVPAFKIIDAKLGVTVRRMCRLEPFRKEIVNTGSYLLVRKFVHLMKSFTETEVHFMKHTLSIKHVTVYKLLKFLLGGHGHAEKLREEGSGEGFSSYMIKTAMIKHHYECRKTDSEEKGSCIIPVLENLLRYKREKCFPLLTFESCTNSYEKSEKLLKRIIEHLRSMQKSTNKVNFIYRKWKLKPVGKQRLAMHKRGKMKNKICCLFLPLLIAIIIVGVIVTLAVHLYDVFNSENNRNETFLSFLKNLTKSF